MRAAAFYKSGGPEVLRIAEVPDPEPEPEDLLVRIFAAGLNRADLLERRGLYAPPPGESKTLGLEFAGKVQLPRAAAGAAARNDLRDVR